MNNPFFKPFETPFKTVPFDAIRISDYEPAFQQAFKEQDIEIQNIKDNSEAPTFENTIVALERSGSLLDTVSTVFFNLLSAETNDEMDALAQKISPKLSEHQNNINLDAKLFGRIKSVYEHYRNGTEAGQMLDKEQQMLLQETYNAFVRTGANLNDKDKEEYRKISARLSLLTLQFEQNHLHDLNGFQLHITDEADLKGLPESAVSAAADEAKKRKLNGWIFTLQAPSYVPFMTYADSRELRKTLWMAYNTLCTHGDDKDNKEIVREIVNLRLRKAQLLGFSSHAEYVLQHRMAETVDNVNNMLSQLIDAYLPTARKEVEAIRETAQKANGEDFELEPWDFSYYANKRKEECFDFNPEQLRPYLELSQVKKGVFGLATRLYGITFKRNENIPVYNPDVEAYEVHDKDGAFLAVMYCDFHPRTSKKSGAWMTSYKEQWKESIPGQDGLKNSRPHVSITMNLTKPTSNTPSLLTLGEVETFLHEFGHSLHGIFANTTYKSLSGTNVLWDFVELPSQFMENYSTEKEFLHSFARHYTTGAPLPDELIDKVVASRNYNAAYACMRQVSFGLLDMAYYSRTAPLEDPIETFEHEAWKRAQLLPQIDGTCMSVQFSHIMSGGYSAGYYSYKWAEILDADAFEKFKEEGIFNQKTAQNFRDNILSRGGTERPMDLYVRFRGQKPTVRALLQRDGINQPD